MKQYSAKKGKKKQHYAHLHEGHFVQIVHDYWWDGWMERVRENTFKVGHA